MRETTEVVTLGNGLRLIFDPIDRLRTCAFGIWVMSGVGYESPQMLGVSHFIEHMVFRGTLTRSSLEIARQTDALGGAFNAYTGRDHTCFYAHTLREHVPKTLEILCDMLTAPRFDPTDLAAEKGVVREEITMYEDSPEDLCADLYYANAWQGSTFGANILGTRDTLAAMTAADLRAHMAQFYTPERTVLSFSGSFDRDAVTAVIQRFFGSRPRGTQPVDRPQAAYTPFFFTQEKEFSQNQLRLGFEGAPLSELRRSRAAEFTAQLLAGASSSRLYQRLRDQLGLVYSIDCGNYAYRNSALFSVTMGLSPEAEPQAIAETVRALRTLPASVTAEEFAIARENIVSRFVLSSESAAAQAAWHAESLMDFGRLFSDEEEITRLREITREEVCAAARELFDFDRLSLCAVGRVRDADAYRALIDAARAEA